MQQKHPSAITFIILILIAVAALGIYFYIKGNPDSNAISALDTSSSPEAMEVQEVGGQVLSLLNEIKSLKIDSSIFSSAVYKSLVDYTVTVPELNVGRPNPFAPATGIILQKTTGTAR